MPAVTLPPADPIQIRNALLQMIEESSLEPICEIRRDDTLANALVSKLADLIKSTTLDDKQLLSFLEALRYPVHLTKGPPGTGMSPSPVNGALEHGIPTVLSFFLCSARSDPKTMRDVCL